MSKYKLVPVEPTPEMVSAAEYAYMPFGDMDLALRIAILAAPDVQVEPVAWIRKWSLDGEKPSKERNKNGRMVFPMKYKLHEVTLNRCLPDDVALYTAPQPVMVVGWQFYQDGKWWYGDDRIKVHRKNTEAAGILVRDLYTTPKPAERQSVLNLSEAARSLGVAQEKGDQGAIDHWGAMVARFEREVIQPAEHKPSAGDSLTPVSDELFAADFAAWWDEHGQFCRAGGGTYERSFAFEAWRHLYPQLMNLQMAAAEQQTAPISALVEALSALRGCIMETRGPDAHSALVLADAALAAYRKQGAES